MINFEKNFQIKEFEKLKKVKPTKDNIKKIVLFIFKNLKFKDHSFKYDAHIFEQMNIYKLLNIYGYGNCKHYAILFKFIMDIMKVDCKMIYANTKKKDKYGYDYNHVFNVITINKKKYLIDCTIPLVEFKKKLININSQIDKKFFINQFLKSPYKVNPNEFYEIYNPKLYTNYSIIDKKFEYKKKLNIYYSELYFYNTPYYSGNLKFNKINNNQIIILNKFSSSKNIRKINFKTIIKVNSNSFSLNNFPFLILNIKILSDKNSNIKIYYQNKKYLVKANAFIFKKNHFFQNPIYSFFVASNKKINGIEITFQKSDLGNKLSKFINSLVK